MLVLALDTSARAGSVALVDGDRILAEREGDPGRSHTERLPADLLDLLRACGVGPASIDLFAVASGPGSFTGLRTGIATIQGLAFATGRQVVPVSVLEATAHLEAERAGTGALVGVWTDAFRKEVFSALYRVEQAPAFSTNRLLEIEPASAGDPAATFARWMAIEPSITIVGDGAVNYSALLKSAPPAPAPIAAAIGRIAALRAEAGLAVHPSAVHPFYVRRPDVEVERDRKSTRDAKDAEDTMKARAAGDTTGSGE